MFIEKKQLNLNKNTEHSGVLICLISILSPQLHSSFEKQ